MKDRDRRPQYHVYLLRLWRESGARRDGGGLWRFSLESPRTHERFGFTSIAALAEFLRRAVSSLDAPADISAERGEDEQEGGE